jgi:enoyl-[acyl-carrier-protein] reductase (NADH)
MNVAQLSPVLEGQKALVVGIANEDPMAYCCAKAFRSVGADLAISKTVADFVERKVRLAPMEAQQEIRVRRGAL